MKNIFSAAIFALALTVSVGASAQDYSFNKNLSIGMRGADVTALQNALASAGYFNQAATGYFGSVTKAAVMNYQRANSINPVSGFVGPLTRGVLNSTSVTTTTATTTTTTTVPTTTAGAEGFAEVRISPTPTNNTNITTTSNIPVYGIEFKAKQSDLSVERLNLRVIVNSSSTANPVYENPSTLINTITVMDGSTVLQTIPVNSSTFTRLSTSTGSLYYVQLAGLGVRVPKDTAKVLTVAFSTNSIDSNRLVDVTVYGTQGIRVVDTRGISSYYGLDDVRSHTFKKPGLSTLTVRDDSTTLYATNYRINRNSNGAEKVLSSTFAAKSETGTSKLNSVTVSVLGATTTPATGLGTLPTTLYLYDGSTLLDARSVVKSTSTLGSVVFDLTSYNVNIDAEVTKTFTIKADLPSDTIAGSLVATRVTGVTYESANGSSNAQTSLTIPSALVYNYFAPAVLQIGKVASTATIIRNGPSGVPSSVEARFALTFTAQGGPVLATNATATIELINASTGSLVLRATSTAVINDEAGLSVYPDGSVKNVTFLGGFATSSLVSGQAYKAKITGITYQVSGDAGVTTLTSGFQALDTASVTY